MSNLDEQFEEFMKESLSTDDSPGTNSSPRNEPHVRMPVPESNPYKFWWMKEKPQTEKNPVEAVSHRSSLSGASGDSPKVDRTYAGISSVRNLSIPKVFSTPSPEITSSVAEFLEKEKLCKELSSSLSEVDSPGMGLDDVTDDDIGSIMEQLSQLAGSGDDGAAEKSVEEILKEAEDLVRETSHSFSGLSDTSDILRTPLTPPLLLRGTGASLFPMSTKSRSGSSTLSSSRRRNSISPSAEKKKKKKRDSARKSDKIVVAEEASEDEFSDFKLDTPLDTLRSFDASITRTGAVDPFVKTKELSKKEKSVTFEDIVSAFPSSCESDVQQRLSVSPIEQRDVQQRPEVRISVSPIEQSDVVVTPEVFQQTDTDVKEEVAAAMHEVTAESHEASSQSGDDSMLSIERELENTFGPSDTPKRPLSVVPEESSVSSLSKSEQSRGRRLSDKSVQVVDGSVVSLQRDLLEERNKVSQLQAKLESDDQEHKTQLDSLRCRHEEEMFNLKKDVYILNAKIADFEKQQDALKVEKGSGDGDTVKEHRITLLETELQQQEQLMLGYQRENVKLCQDMKQLREEMKTKEESFATERQQLSSARQGKELDRLTDCLKDKDEVIVRLQLEVESLREKNRKMERAVEELRQLNVSLLAELDKHKRVTVAQTTKVTAPRGENQERLKQEIAKKEAQLEDIRKELHRTQAEVTAARAEVEENQLQIGGLETKVSELHTSLNTERAQTQANSLKMEEDKKKIQDLDRQVKEMERILKRNHPNSISALILTANSDGSEPTAVSKPRLKYLENRVHQLEQELSKSETEAQSSVKDIQDKFQAMKMKYEEHTSDLELQLATAKHQAHMWRQAAEKNEARVEEAPTKDMMKQVKKVTAPPMVITVGAPSLNALSVREDAHLLATIRGLKAELSSKDKELAKIRRDLDESTKTNRRLQRERERQLGIVTAPSRPPTVRGAAKEELLSEPIEKTYEANGVEDGKQQDGLKRLEQENGMLRQELIRLEEDFRGLQTKRLQDLNLLQEQHEVEMDRLVSDHVARHSNSRVADLQGQLSTQQIVITHLKKQLNQMDEYREETEMLKAERDHLEKSNIELKKKLADLRSVQTPEALQYEALQDKLSELERRHETREQKLQAMVRDLLRQQTTVEDSSAATMREKLLDKNRQLCLYRAEIDRILDTLREFNRHKKSGSNVQLVSD